MRIHGLIKAALPALFAGISFAGGSGLTPVPSANTKTEGFAAPNILSPELTEAIVAQGSMKLENPSALTSYLRV